MTDENKPEHDYSKPEWRVAYAYTGSDKAWFQFNGNFSELMEMIQENLSDTGVGEMYIKPLGFGGGPNINRKAAYRPIPEISLPEPDQNKTPVPELVGLLIREGNRSGVWFEDELIEAATALTTLAAENERLREYDWKPIETAPTDGSKFIAAKFVGHPDHENCFWWACTCSWSDKWQKWWDGIEPCGLAGPTHWRPAGRPASAPAKLDQAMGEK